MLSVLNVFSLTRVDIYFYYINKSALLHRKEGREGGGGRESQGRREEEKEEGEEGGNFSFSSPLRTQNLAKAGFPLNHLRHLRVGKTTISFSLSHHH